MRNSITTRILYAAILVVSGLVLFSGHVGAAEPRRGDAKIMFGDGTEVGAGNFCWDSNAIGGTNCSRPGYFNDYASVSVGTITAVLWSQMKASPVTEGEYIVGNLDTSGKLELLRYASPSWILDWTEGQGGGGSSPVGSPSIDSWAFDIAYENSGEAVVAWGRTDATTTELEYRVWDGVNWGASTSYELSLNAGDLTWIDLYPHPATGSNQNDITLCYASSERYNFSGTFRKGTKVGCAVWDGDTNTWGNEKIITSDGEQYGRTNPGTSHAFSGFYEQGSGDFIGVAGVEVGDSDVTKSILFSTFSSISAPTWTATSSFTFLDNSNFLQCAPMPYISSVTTVTNRAACVNHDGMPATLDTNGTIWNGSAFGTNSAIDSAAIASASNRFPITVGWLNYGAASPSRNAVVLVGSSDTTDVDYRKYRGGNNVWGTAQTFASTTGTDNNYMFVQDPTTFNRGVGFLVDSNSDLFAYTASIDRISGTTVNWNAKGRITGDLATPNGYPFSFAFSRAPKIDQQHFRWKSNDGTTLGDGTMISAEDVPASGSKALPIGAISRLRVELSNEGTATTSNDNWQLEFTRKSPTNPSCATPAPGWDWREMHVNAVTASDAFDIEDSVLFSNGAATADEDNGSLTNSSNDFFLPGQAIDAASSTSAFALGPEEFTELEYAFRPNANANTSATYCFRVTRANLANTTASMVYSMYAKASVSNLPFTQNDHEWFYNADNVQPGASINGTENTQADIGVGVVPRLRMNVTVENIALAGGEPPGDWCNITNYCTTDWLARRKITLNNSASAENLINFPILVTLKTASSSVDYSKIKDSGADIRFIDASGASLSYEIEKWDEADTTYIWVKVPQIDSGSTTDYIYMYYNNTDASDFQRPIDVWDTNYLSVLHLNQDPAVAGADGILDSTRNDNDGTDIGTMDDNDLVAGKIGDALSFDGTDDAINLGDLNAIDGATTLSFSGWVRQSALADTRAFFSKQGGGQDGPYIMTSTAGGGDNDDILFVNNEPVGRAGHTSANIHAANVWTHYAFTFDGGQSGNANILKVYKNGVSQALTFLNDMQSAIQNNSASVYISGMYGGGTTFFNGLIDEVRMSTNARSTDWIEAEYNWGREAWDYNTFDDEETYTAVGTTQFKLQYATDINGSWTDVGVGAWAFYGNAGVADGATLTSALVSTTDVLQTYQESNPSVANVNSATVGEDIEYDWSLDPDSATSGTAYYFRMVSSNGDIFESYDQYPTIVISGPVEDPGPAIQSGGGGGGTGGSSGGSGGGSAQGGGGQSGDGSSSGSGDSGASEGESGGGSPQGGGGSGGGGASPVLYSFWDYIRLFISWLSSSILRAIN